MKNIEENLFYSKSESILFYVAGYTDSSEGVAEMVKVLTTGANALAELIKADFKDVKTFFVTDSRRYKNMRVFYIETPIIPKGAFVIGENNHWTMSEWIRG